VVFEVIVNGDGDSQMRKRVRDWWAGKYIPPENPPGSAVFFVQGSYEQHWTSRVAHVISNFWLKHWQWCFGAVFATAGLIIAAMKL
jgi:hypothetical protein